MGGNWRKGEKEEDNGEHVAGTKEDVEELHVENGHFDIFSIFKCQELK